MWKVISFMWNLFNHLSEVRFQRREKNQLQQLLEKDCECSAFMAQPTLCFRIHPTLLLTDSGMVTALYMYSYAAFHTRSIAAKFKTGWEDSQNYRLQNRREYEGKTTSAQTARPCPPPLCLHSYTIWLLYRPGGTHRAPPPPLCPSPVC